MCGTSFLRLRMRPVVDFVVTWQDAPTGDRLEQRRLARLGPAQDQVQLVGLEDGRDAVQGGDGAPPPPALEEALDGVGHGLVDGGEGRGLHAHAYLMFVGVGGCFFGCACVCDILTCILFYIYL